ncbi:hypothetical protein QQZ08_004520 [Neonectria magnoliae]|uniref:Subtelomeric hrmA-associated cluster protein AFUB-079030/YDR124W-like helical bundle domain-containing protein n=1 Tax=Neonectria magnoliae TaxID=2732573 RepID=A0ABR1I5X6_9HYPO
MVRDWQRDSFPRHYMTERYGPDAIDDARFAETQDIHRRQPPMQIDEALRQHCSISAKRYFVAVIMDDGSPMTFSGPGTARLDGDVMRQFFDLDKYQKVMDCLDAGASPVVDEAYTYEGLYKQASMDFPRNRLLDRRRMSNFDEWDAPGRQGRKRPRARHPVIDDDDIPMVISTTRKGIKIGNAQDVWNFYEQRFKNCQQTACKLIAKAWVKAVEPKKQSTHPYTGSDEKAPEWWPRPWGPTKEDRVRHKEPDHLYKRERVHLLNHILRMIVEPKNRQHPDIQKLNLSVRKLEEITTEALSAFFTDKENPSNAKKRPYLNEIFKVARQEERYKREEIDGGTEVYVMAEDKMPETYGSENDDGSITKDEDEQDIPAPKLSTVQGMIPTATSDHGSGPTLHGPPFLGDLPVRGTQYGPPMISDIAPDHHGFAEGSNMSVSGQTPVHPPGGSLALDMGVPAPQDSSRRPSLIGDYSGQSENHMYTQQWQPSSTASNTPGMYSFTQQQANPSATSFVSPVVPMSQSQSYMGGSFDGLSHGYDPGQAPMFRGGGSVPQQPVHTSPSYNYRTSDNRGLSAVKADPVSRNSMH